MAQIIIFLVVLAISIAIQLLFPPEGPEKPKANDIDAFDISTASEERVIPDLVGDMLIKGLNCIWYGDLEDEPINIQAGKSEQTIGYAYFLSLLFVVSKTLDYMSEWWINDEKVSITGGTVTGVNTTFTVKTGQESRTNGSGNGLSLVRFADGTQTAPLSFMEAATGRAASYRNCALLWMRGAFVGDNVTSIPRYAGRFGNFSHLAPELDQDFVNVNGDANPIFAIYYAMTKRKRITAGRINLTNFNAVAEVCFNEGLGVSFLMNRAQGAREWIREILRHIDGVLYMDLETGLFNIRLMRDDYVIEELPTYDESQFSDFVMIRRSWADTPTDLEVKYTTRQKWARRTINFVNPAARRVLGYLNKQTIDFSMFTQDAPVANALTRLKVRLFYPNATVKFRISDLDFDHNPGEVIKLNYARYGLTGLVLRIVNIGGAASDDQTLEVECLEDIFGIGRATISEIPSSGWTPINYELLDPMTLAFIRDALPEMIDPVDDSLPMVMVAGSPPASGSTANYGLKLSGTSAGDRPYDGTGVLEDDYLDAYGSEDGNPAFMDRLIGFTIESGINITTVTHTDARWQRLYTVCLIDSGGNNVECMSVKSIEDLGGGRYKFLGLLRGIAGSKIISHDAGARVWVHAGEGFAFNGTNTTSLSIAAQFRAKNFLNTAPPLTINHTYTYRPQTPYPPANVTASRTGDAPGTCVVMIVFDFRNRHRGLTNSSIDEWPINTGEVPEAQFVLDGLPLSIPALPTPLIDGSGSVGLIPFLPGDDAPYGRGFIQLTGKDPTPETFTLETLLNGLYSGEPVIFTV